MFLFVLKKYLSDLWENFIPLMILNLLSLLPFLLGFSLSSVEGFPVQGFFPVRTISLLMTLFLLGAVGVYAKDLAAYEKVRKDRFLPALAESFKDIFGGFLLLGFFSMAIYVAVIFYIERLGNPGVILAGLVILVGLLGYLGAPFYFAARYQEGLGFRKSWVRAFQFLFSNLVPALTAGGLFFLVIVAMVSLINFVILRNPQGISYFENLGFSVVLGLAVFVLGFLPGPGGFMLWYQNFFRIGRLGEQWRQDHNTGTIPWKEILKSEEELLDQRKDRSSRRSGKDQSSAG